MILHIADTICEAECSDEGQKFIIELSPWEASIVSVNFPANPSTPALSAWSGCYNEPCSVFRLPKIRMTRPDPRLTETGGTRVWDLPWSDGICLDFLGSWTWPRYAIKREKPGQQTLFWTGRVGDRCQEGTALRGFSMVSG